MPARKFHVPGARDNSACHVQTTEWGTFSSQIHYIHPAVCMFKPNIANSFLDYTKIHQDITSGKSSVALLNVSHCENAVCGKEVNISLASMTLLGSDVWLLFHYARLAGDISMYYNSSLIPSRLYLYTSFCSTTEVNWLKSMLPAPEHSNHQGC